MIKVGMNLPDVKALCKNYLLETGAGSFWYWDAGAFVFAGDETAVSVLGKDYKVPHISIPESKYGYKREDIYYFDNGKLIKL